MAFNFGAEAPPPSLPVEDSGYVVGQENGYSGVRVRIKSLKSTKKEEEAEKIVVNEPPPPNNKPPDKEATAVKVKQESLPQAVELKLFDLPPIAVNAPEAGSAAPDMEAGVTTAEAEAEVIMPTEASTAAIRENAGSKESGEVVAESVEVIPEKAGPTEVRLSTTESDVTVAETAWLATPDAGSTDNGEETPGKASIPGKPVKSKRGRKSLKQVAAEADLIEIPGDDILFSKQYYTMRAVAEMFRVNQSLLRFWETEFDILQPRKNKKGDRYFRPVDIKNLHLIYHLLRQRKYTIEGAKEFLKKNKKAEERFEAIQRLQQLKAFLLEWKAQL